MIEFIARTQRCWRDLYTPWDFAFIAVIAAVAAFVPDAQEIFISSFTLVAVSGSIMIAVVGAVVAAAAVLVSFLPKEDLRKIANSGHGLADELWAFEFVVFAAVATLAVGIVGNALIDRSFEEPQAGPQRAFILLASALLMLTVLGVARLVRVVREIAELRLSLDDEDDGPESAAG